MGGLWSVGPGGQPPFDGTYAPRMPKGYDPVPDDKIKQISDWIDAGCLT